MRNIKNIIVIFSFFFFGISVLCAEEVTVVYSGQTHSMLYPCSCPIAQDGGIARRGTLIKQLRKKSPDLLLLDCGSFTAGGLMDEYTQNAQLDLQRSEVNYRALELMHYDAVGISPDEFNFGREFFLKNAKKSKPAFLSVNLDSDKVVPYIIKNSGTTKIAIVGLTGLLASQRAEGLKISPPDKLVSALVDRLKNEGTQIIILLSTQGEIRDLKLIAQTKGIDIVFVGYQPKKEEAITKVDSTFFVRPAWQGRKLGKLTLKIEAGKLIDCKLDELVISEKLSDDPEITAILPRCYSDVNCKQGGLTGSCQNPGTLNANCSFTRPNPVNLFVINVNNCVTCDAESVIDLLKKKFPGLTVKILDYPGQAAKKMIKDLGLETLPAYIFTKSVEKEEIFDSFKKDLSLINDFYVYKPQASGISYFLNQKTEKGSFDLFFSIFEKDAALLLTTLREFNPGLHFLAVEKDEGFDAKNGIAEVEEYLRAGCVQKYYPEKFWDYLICRAKNIGSSYWEDCLGESDVSKIRSCARGQEGIGLLRGITSLNKKLQISSGPSYLLNNQEIFASRGVPAKEDIKKILKR
ncbi:MAG TPA: hypothetical protein PL125_00475 [Candidatus Omnitrophota bacterium]|nr:hypothetical protein [Candidatus Omnitrophota bacterium]HPT38664.1 hypothetical protein [Candidatus Omnitrophota bacterium]